MALSTRYILFFSMLLCGGISVLFGKELCWDLANYHFYNPFALLHSRYTQDYWPNSNIHQYINPTIDLLSYFLIQTFTPRMSEFILGAIHGVNLWLLFLIAKYFLQDRFKNSLAFVIALLGLCGPTALPGIGSFQNDNLVSIFVLACVLLTLHRYQFLAGIILGLGFGLKLTAGIYIAGAMIAMLLLPISFHLKIKSIFMFGIGLAIGMLITSGYWMIMMWHEHHNPIFPFFNRIFHSPDFSQIDWRDERFLPKTLTESLFYPFYFSFDGRTADGPFRDFRFLILYVLLVLTAIKCLLRRASPQKDYPRIFLFTFFIFSYIIWQMVFSIARYLAPLEMLAPLMIYLLIQHMVKDTLICFTLTFMLFFALLFTLSPIPMVRAPWYDNTFFNVKLPAFVENTPNATVLIAYSAYVLNADPRPQSYLIPFFPKQWRFIGVPLLHEKIFLDAAAFNLIQAKLTNDTHEKYLLTSDRNMPELYKAARLWGLTPNGKCEEIESDRQVVTHQKVLLCPVGR